MVPPRFTRTLVPVATLFLFLSFCSLAGPEVPQFPVAGTLAGQPVATTVDSQLAKYYLEHYLPGQHSNADNDRAIDGALRELKADPSDPEALRQLSQRFSVDFAAIHFVARLYESPANYQGQEAFHTYLEKLTHPAASTVPIPEAYKSYLFAFVPGYAYKKDRTTGADFARQRQIMSQQGFQTALIETNEQGSVEENAASVLDKLLRLAQRHDKIVLVSASKGGPEAALALGELLPAEALGPVRAWISVGGILRGSPYADQALWWPKRWFAELVFAIQGLRPNVIRNLSTVVRRPVFGRLRFPPHILKLQYVGVPLSGHIGKSTRGRYKALRPLGPNDGLTLLADELVPDGIVVTDVGLDHYYRDPAIQLKTLALAYVVLEKLEQQKKKAESAVCR